MFLRRRLWLMFSTAYFALLVTVPGVDAQCSMNLGLGSAYIAPMPGNPFQAELVTASPNASFLPANAPLRQRSVAAVARDSQGRVRIERSGGMFNVRTGTGSEGQEEQQFITICEGETGRGIILDTISKTARIVGRSPSAARLGEKSPQRYCKLPDSIINSQHFRVEDLGHRVIEGFDAEGFLISSLSTLAANSGGAATVQSTRELWCSEELGAVILQVQHMLRDMKLETTLTNVKRQEPDASLFEIPPDYTVTERVIERPRPQRPASPDTGGVLQPLPPPKP
jgi:hypothetical protein